MFLDAKMLDALVFLRSWNITFMMVIRLILNMEIDTFISQVQLGTQDYLLI